MYYNVIEHMSNLEAIIYALRDMALGPTVTLRAANIKRGSELWPMPGDLHLLTLNASLWYNVYNLHYGMHINTLDLTEDFKVYQTIYIYTNELL